MKDYFLKLKIVQKFALIFLLILASVVTSYGVMFWFNAKQKTQRVQIDIAGRNRMLSQRIGAMSLLVDTDNADQAAIAKEEMRKAMVLMEQTLLVLRDGGLAPGIEGSMVLPPAQKIIVPKINEVLDFFQGHKEVANTILNESRLISISAVDSIPTKKISNPAFEDALHKLRQRLLNGTLLKLSVELTQQFTQEASESKNAMAILVGLLVVNISIVGMAFFFLRKTLRPLGTLTEQISVLSSGHLPPSLKIVQADEVGQMANALNALSANLGSATEFAKNVGAGNLETAVQVFDGNGDLSQSLSLMRDNLKVMAEDDKKRAWSTEGLAKFADILRAHRDLKTLGESIVSNLVKYTQSNQGSLFVVNDENKNEIHLELLSCYAFNRKKFLEKKILPGEGLSGQAYLEKETIFLKSIPKNFVTITSGLGEATPTAVLIVPLKINEEIVGTIEIASFQEYQPHEISFVEKLAENIASTILGVKVNERTQQLLEQSQQQAEQMRASEEELRQNMEELSATQEEMARKEAEYIKRIEKLEGHKVKA